MSRPIPRAHLSHGAAALQQNGRVLDSAGFARSRPRLMSAAART